MGTRSNIGILHEDGTTTLVYCHFDGYPSSVGRILLHHYASEDAANGLVALGDMSSLGENILPPEGVKHSYENRVKGVTVYYSRDRGEDWNGVKPQTLQPGENPLQQEWCYLWDVRQGCWIFVGHPPHTSFKKLEEKYFKDQDEE